MGLLFGYFHFIYHVKRQRGFYCDDESLKHPYVKNETVPMMMAFGIWVFALLATVIPTECLVDRTRPDRHCQSNTLKLCGVYIPTLVLELYRVFGYFFVGCSFCMMFTDISKNTIGRLRPHFFSICQPWEHDSYVGNCTETKDNVTYQAYIGDKKNDEDVCKNVDSYPDEVYKKMLKEARLSFMSGHSSFSFFCAVFLIIYLQIRVPSINLAPDSKHSIQKTATLLMNHTRIFWQFALGILAFWIAMTRIADYFHHPTDVVTGCLVGILCAVLTLFISGLSKKEYVFSVPETEESIPKKVNKEKSEEIEV